MTLYAYHGHGALDQLREAMKASSSAPFLLTCEEEVRLTKTLPLL